MAKIALLISQLPEDRSFAEVAAQVAGIPLQVVGTPEQATAQILKEDVAAILVDASSEAKYRQLEETIQNSIGLFSDRISANAIHFLSNENLEDVPYLVQSPIFGHFIMRNYQDQKEAGEQYGLILKATQTDRAFGLGSLLRPGAKTQVVKLQNSLQKHDAVEAVKNYLIAAKFQSRMAMIMANAVDELLMNAMFDAPVDAVGRQIFATMPRSTSVDLKDKHSVEMHVGYDGRYAAITAVDLFGSLDKARLLAHISKIYTAEEYKVRTSVAGAGIGLATVFRSGGSFFFVSEANTRTEVTVFFKRTDTFRSFKDQFRFLSTQFYF